MRELPADRAPDLNHVAVSGRTAEGPLATAQPAGVDQVEVGVVGGVGVGTCRTREGQHRRYRDDDRKEPTTHETTIGGGRAGRLRCVTTAAKPNLGHPASVNVLLPASDYVEAT